MFGDDVPGIGFVLSLITRNVLETAGVFFIRAPRSQPGIHNGVEN